MCAWPGCDEGHSVCNPHWRKLNDDERWAIRMAVDCPFYGGKFAPEAWGSAIDGTERLRALDAPDYRTWNSASGVESIFRVLRHFEFHTTIQACCAQAEERVRRRENGRLQRIIDRTNEARQMTIEEADRLRQSLRPLFSRPASDDDGSEPIGEPPCS